MNIALDYDGTYTSDPSLWLRFVLDAQASGHTVHVVTMRYPSEVVGGKSPMDPRLNALGCRIIPTGRKAKRKHCAELGVEIHIWIDDFPQAVDMDAAQIWPDNGAVAPEGSPVEVKYE